MSICGCLRHKFFFTVPDQCVQVCGPLDCGTLCRIAVKTAEESFMATCAIPADQRACSASPVQRCAPLDIEKENDHEGFRKSSKASDFGAAIYIRRAAKLNSLKGVRASLSPRLLCARRCMLPKHLWLRRFATAYVSLARAAHAIYVSHVQRGEHCGHAADLCSDLWAIR